jgi:hypothetical protein
LKVPALISTEVSQLYVRLPPIRGLLDDTVGQALRARQRRVFVVDNANLNLGALRVCDDAIDKALVSASLYGQDAAAHVTAKISASTGGAQDAAVFLRVALAIQMRDPVLLDITEKYFEQHLQAVRDAFWFYPVPGGPFSDNIDHIVSLFERSNTLATLRPLALELVGRRDVKQLCEQVYALRLDPQVAADAHLALACMDKKTESTQEFIRKIFAADSPAHRQSAVSIAAVRPSLADDAALYQAIGTEGPNNDLAWALLACRQPRRAIELAKQNSDIAPSLWLRIVSLTGYLDTAIQACADMAATESAVSAQQADVLELVFGTVHVDARTEPSSAVDKSKALRDTVLRVCRQAHIKLHNDADTCAWDINQILVDPAQAARLRLRCGKAMQANVPAFTASAFEVTHALRQWLYIERASCANHALSLSAVDVARRQQLALMVTQFAES